MIDTGAFMGNAIDMLVEVGIFVAIILIGVLLGYLIGVIISFIIKRLLSLRELKEQIAGSEIITLALWGKIINGVSVYIKWLFVSILLNYAVDVSIGRGIWYAKLSTYTSTFQSLMAGLGVFVLFSVVGIVVGAIIYRIIKAALDSVRLEEKLTKHDLHDALGGLELTRVVAGIFMVYVVIIFLASGIDAVATPIGQEANRLVIMFHYLVFLYPEFVLGAFIIIAGALIGDFLDDSIKKSKTALAGDGLGWVIQGVVIFFAVVLALPHFQIRENVDVLTDSFKILVAGLSIGLAIAMGLGLKDTFSHLGKKIEKKI